MFVYVQYLRHYTKIRFFVTFKLFSFNFLGQSNFCEFYPAKFSSFLKIAILGCTEEMYKTDMSGNPVIWSEQQTFLSGIQIQKSAMPF